jgi:hypothetical protein
MRTALILVVALLAGCTPAQRIIVLAPPAGYLEPCELPALPDGNPDLSQAFVQAYKCAELGNADKERIIQWQRQVEAQSR